MAQRNLEHDVIADSCIQERPDIFWDRGDYCVVLEVDEDQHKKRPEECECARMVNLHSNFGRPTYFIRFNPDDYSTAEGSIGTMLSLKKRMSILTDWLSHAKAIRMM